MILGCPDGRGVVPYSAFIAPHGHFEGRCMAFGLRNGPSTYQQMMHTMLKVCATFTSSYLDYVVINLGMMG